MVTHTSDGRRDGIVGIVSGLRAGCPKNDGSIRCRGRDFISSPKRPDRLWETLSVPLMPKTAGASSCSLMACSAEVKNELRRTFSYSFKAGTRTDYLYVFTESVNGTSTQNARGRMMKSVLKYCAGGRSHI